MVDKKVTHDIIDTLHHNQDYPRNCPGRSWRFGGYS